jgi:hypothetical protein
MATSCPGILLFVIVLLVSCCITLPSVSATDTGGHLNIPDALFPGTPSYSGPSRESVPLAAPGPVSDTFIPPPGVMPVVILEGNPYEMGYQYGLSVPDYIASVRDAAWASALTRSSYTDVIDNCSIARSYIRSELPGFDFIAFFNGITDAMNAQGIPFSENDPIIMHYYGGRQGPGPDEHCTVFVAGSNATGGPIIAAENFDYYPVPSNSYSVLLVMYPDDGHSCILPAGAGRTGTNAVVNDEGLIFMLSSAPLQGPGDTGPGIIGFLELPYIGITAGSVRDAEPVLINMTRGFALNHVLADPSGDIEVIEATRARYAIRTPCDTGTCDYLIVTNHYLNPAMKPSQRIWDPLAYYPSSYYRYITAEKMLNASHSRFSYADSVRLLSSTDWWDGTSWHRDDPWSGNTINRFRPDITTLYSFIALPDERLVSICSGNPGVPFWGTRAAGQTGTYVNYTLGVPPGAFVYNLKTDAEAMMWDAFISMENCPATLQSARWDAIEDQYWEGIWWHNRAVLENDRASRMVAFGKAATAYSGVIARAGEIRSACYNERDT